MVAEEAQVFQELLFQESHIPLPTCLVLATEKISVEKLSSLVAAVAVFGTSSYH
jgi:hypothetical protein